MFEILGGCCRDQDPKFKVLVLVGVVQLFTITLGKVVSLGVGINVRRLLLALHGGLIFKISVEDIVLILVGWLGQCTVIVVSLLVIQSTAVLLIG